MKKYKIKTNNSSKKRMKVMKNGTVKYGRSGHQHKMLKRRNTTDKFAYSSNSVLRDMCSGGKSVKKKCK